MPNQRPENLSTIAIAGCVLAVFAGYTNVVTILQSGGLSSSHVTGTVSRLAIEVSGGPGLPLPLVLGAILAFVGGAAIAGAALQTTEVRLGQRYGALLLVESALMATAAILMRGNHLSATVVAASACGLQNGLGTHVSRAIVRTTHVTGLATDLGLALGKLIGRRSVDTWRLPLYFGLFCGFFIGAILGGIGSVRYGQNALWAPAIGLAALGIAYTVASRTRWTSGHTQRNG